MNIRPHAQISDNAILCMQVTDEAQTSLQGDLKVLPCLLLTSFELDRLHARVVDRKADLNFFQKQWKRARRELNPGPPDFHAQH